MLTYLLLIKAVYTTALFISSLSENTMKVNINNTDIKSNIAIGGQVFDHSNTALINDNIWFNNTQS